METTPINWIPWLTNHGFADLFEIKENQPHTFDGISWSPVEADRLAAWEFYTELRTRITTQRLAYRAGDEDAALDSVYQLFALSRGIIKANNGCTHFATLTIRVLNTRVRPFTAKWHRVKLEGHLSSADERFKFRRELSALQIDLRKLTHLIGILAEDHPQIARQEEKQAASASQELLAPLQCGIEAGMRDSNSRREEINRSEAAEIRARRKRYAPVEKKGEVDAEGEANTAKDAAAVAGTVEDEVMDAVGLSISGGGIRSATFALGVVQQLARKGILHQIDYLSTVSGGGYLGAFISSFLNHEEGQVSLKPEKDNLPFGAEKDPESRAVRQLRNHSKYLIEGGISTLALITALIVYGVITSVLLLSPFLLTSVLISAGLFQESFRHPSLPLNALTIAVLIELGIFIFLLPFFGQGRGLQSPWGQICIWLAAVSLLCLAGESLPYLLAATKAVGGPPGLFFSVVAAPVVLGALGLWLGVGSIAGRVVLGLLTIVGPLLMLAVFLWLVDVFVVMPSEPRLWLLAVLTPLSWLYSSFALNINYASPHAFYRDRLARTYLVRPADGDESVCLTDPQRLSDMNKSEKAPYHLINCAVNIPNSKEPDLRGRNTDFFVFSKHFCGGPMAGFHPTVDWEKIDPHLDLGTVTAISGAAAAPHMGTLTSARFIFLLALLNVRLSYWLRNPTPDGNPLKRLLHSAAWYQFFLELSGGCQRRPRTSISPTGGTLRTWGFTNSCGDAASS